ncbi:MAG TPA: transposase [Woeseiaceae bacterium]
MDVMIPRRRRKHSEAFKQSVIGSCCEPGQSVAGVALTHGLNANLNFNRQHGLNRPGFGGGHLV